MTRQLYAQKKRWQHLCHHCIDVAANCLYTGQKDQTTSVCHSTMYSGQEGARK
jgi:hypothetical protein